jgi:SAM-dependent methyltransferase
MDIEDKIEMLYTFDSRRNMNTTIFDNIKVGSDGYGETGFVSIEYLISDYEELFNEELFTEDTVFYDLGSGTGKIVYHIGYLYNVKKSCGIEFSKERHLSGISLKEKYNLPDNNSISLINGNILDFDISDATVIYCDNTLFPIHINRKIYDKIPKGCIVFSKAPITKNREEVIRTNIVCVSEYGTDSLYIFKKN